MTFVCAPRDRRPFVVFLILMFSCLVSRVSIVVGGLPCRGSGRSSGSTILTEPKKKKSCNCIPCHLFHLLQSQKPSLTDVVRKASFKTRRQTFSLIFLCLPFAVTASPELTSHLTDCTTNSSAFSFWLWFRELFDVPHCGLLSHSLGGLLHLNDDTAYD
jgi:hypothetical protein